MRERACALCVSGGFSTSCCKTRTRSNLNCFPSDIECEKCYCVVVVVANSSRLWKLWCEFRPKPLALASRSWRKHRQAVLRVRQAQACVWIDAVGKGGGSLKPGTRLKGEGRTSPARPILRQTHKQQISWAVRERETVPRCRVTRLAGILLLSS